MTSNDNSSGNPHPWLKTPSLLNFISEKVGKEEGLAVLKRLPTRISYYSEKLDGTNVSKDSDGNIFSRYCRLPPTMDNFQKTSLDAVKEVDVGAFRDRFSKLCGVFPLEFKLVLFGELICNKVYNYEKEGMLEDWRIFGAKLVPGEFQTRMNFTKYLSEAGLVFFPPEKETGNIQILLNRTFARICNEFGLKTPRQVELCCEHTQSFEVSLNKIEERMLRGQGEGYVILLQNPTTLLKLKGAQEVADRAIDKFKSAVEVIQTLPGCEDLKRVCRTILTTQTDVTQNLVAAFRKQNKILKDWNLKINKKSLPVEGVEDFICADVKSLVAHAVPVCSDNFIPDDKMRDRADEIPALKDVIVREVRIYLRTQDGVGADHEDTELCLMTYIKQEVDRYCMMKMDL